MNLSTSSSNLRLEILRITRRNGVILRSLAYSGPAHSFVQQWVQITKSVWAQLGEANVKDTGGVNRNFNQNNLTIIGPAANTTYGIILGTGTNAVTITDYALQTKINHGSAAGQLSYAAQLMAAYSLVGSTAKFKATRQYQNLSGGTITVNETAIYIRDGSGQYFCLLRDLVPGGFPILNTQIAEFRYAFKATV